MKTFAFLLAAATLATAAAPAAAQDYSQEPSYGSVTLYSGFTPDPYRVNLQSGGSIDAGNLGSPCTGFIANAPDFRLNYESGSLPLYITVASGADTTLVINAPDGSWYCNDDTNGVDPLVTFTQPQSGQYDIWVGTYGGSDLNSAELRISELYSE